jgi:heme-degrading monooxygenase HmoA
MFERYTESARRVLFFARDEVAQLGGRSIEPEHLVLGLLRDESSPLHRFLGAGHAAAAMRARLLATAPRGDAMADRVEVPFSEAAKTAIQRAALAADQLQNEWIGPEHLVLGVLEGSGGAAADALHAAGVRADAIRQHLRSVPEPEAPPTVSPFGPGMVARIWKGVLKTGMAEEYLRHLRGDTFPALRALSGHLGASILRRDVEDGTEFQITTVWRSLDAIKAFAGDDVTVAVVPPAAQAMMVRYDPRAVHYQIVE